ncbi:MAG: hypothetical protein KDB27_04700 [Planctomycetales bacterium]|nr:hypothetical protein [Planctomycetales bacterium]
MEPNSRAVTNYVSNPSNETSRTDLVASWKHLATVAAATELGDSYEQLAISLETSFVDEIRATKTEAVPARYFSNAITPNENVWRFWDRGGSLESAWTSRSFDDSERSEGPAPLGYGEPGVATTVCYGGDGVVNTPRRSFGNRFHWRPQNGSTA